MSRILNMSGKCILGCGLALAMLVPLGSAEAQVLWKETVLYSFCSVSNDGHCDDGGNPSSGVVEDGMGNLYGTTLSGGPAPAQSGTVFELTPPAQGQTQWNEQVLVSFDGGTFAEPDGVIIDPNCNSQSCQLYGTSSGPSYGFNGPYGGVFSLRPPPPKWMANSIWVFTSGEYGRDDGSEPNGGVIKVNGNLFGTTAYSGFAPNPGTVFETGSTPGGGDLVLHQFCSQAPHYPYCADGWHPVAGLVADTNGNLYGTTENGNADRNCGTGNGCGIVFELSPPLGGTTSGYQFCVLWSFHGGNDGIGSVASLIVDSKGNLYGTTTGGGNGGNTGNNGTVFELTPPAQGAACPSMSQQPPMWWESVLYTFKGAIYNDGCTPQTGVIMVDGNLYGTTEGCGVINAPEGGTVFELTPPGQGQKQWNETVLYYFCSQGGNNCTDGAEPGGGLGGNLIADVTGNGNLILYGTTYIGGANGWGTVFELTPPSG
jgi:uncharacterized repeat protein (TIGR03803 family)